MTTPTPPDGTGSDAAADGPPLGGRYEVGELIGRGGMADVRAGHDGRLGRTVAIKRLRPDLASDPIFQARFRREAQSAASLNHPAIVAVYDTGDEVAEDGGRVPYIVMEHVEGRTLREILREGRKVLPERALEITADVLSALDYSHRAGIVHRDIKPANVMLTPRGRVKVMDFGIARAIADASSTMTATAAVVGTAQYLSPEQARGEQVDARSDIYSTGCMLFELLTTRPPFVGDSPVAVAYQHVREDPPVPSSLEPEVSPAIDAVVAKALAKKVSERYQSAAQMRADIERALAGQDVEAPLAAVASGAATATAPDDASTSVFGSVPAGEPAEEGPPRRRRRWWLWVLLALLVAGLVGATAYLLAGGGNDESTTSVPDVVGRDLDDATRVLEAAGFAVDPTREPSNQDKGVVTGTDPGSGDPAPDGSTVAVTVSSGPRTVSVPDGLVGSARRDAAAALADAGLDVTFTKEQDDADQGQVIAADPSEGEAVSPDTTVTLVVSTGPTFVPSVVGETRRDAKALIADAGYEPFVTAEPSDADRGIVVEQSPAADTEAEPGTQVTIVVSNGPEETTTEPTTTEPTTTEETTTEETTTEETTTEETTTETTTTEETTTETTTTEETTTEETTTTPPTDPPKPPGQGHQPGGPPGPRVTSLPSRSP